MNWRLKVLIFNQLEDRKAIKNDTEQILQEKLHGYKLEIKKLNPIELLKTLIFSFVFLFLSLLKFLFYCLFSLIITKTIQPYAHLCR